MNAVFETNLKGAKLLNRGRRRDIYSVPAKGGKPAAILLVATDRLSAFDVVMAEPIPDKGKVLTQISNFWFDKFEDPTPHHAPGRRLDDVGPSAGEGSRHRLSHL